MLGIRCDRVGCGEQLWGLAFDAKPVGWTVIDHGHGDHMDYCPNHVLEKDSNKEEVSGCFPLMW